MLRVERRSWVAWWLAFWLTAWLPAWAQAPGATEPPEQGRALALEELQGKLTAAQAATDLDPAVQARLVELLQSAIQFTQQSQKAAADSVALAREIETAPERLKALRTELEELRKVVPGVGVSGEGLGREALEERQRQKEREAGQAEEKLREAEAALGRLRGSEALRELLADTEARLKQLGEELKAPFPSDLHPQVADAERAQLLARQQLRTQELQAYQRELAGVGERRDLRSAERDLAQRKLALLKAEVEAWRELVQQARQEEATRARQEAERAKRLAARQPVEIRELAEENVRLSKELEELAGRAAEVGTRSRAVRERTAGIVEDYARARRRYEAAGLTETLGLRLRQLRQELPGRGALRQSAAARRVEIERVALERIQAEEARLALPELKEKILAALEQAGAELPPEIGLARALALLADAERLLGSLWNDYGAYLQSLEELEEADRAQLAAADEFRGFIDKHLLWSRSAAPVLPMDLTGLVDTFVWLAEPSLWQGVAEDLVASLGRNPVTWGLGLLAFLGLYLGRRRLRRRLKADIKRAGSVLTDSFYSALEALVLTALIALPVPFLLALVGWHLGSATGEFTRSIGSGLRVAAFFAATTSFIAGLCKPEGVGQVHFRWPLGARSDVLRNLRWFAPVLVSIGFVLGVTEAFEGRVQLQDPGRIALMLLMLALSALAAILFRPGGGVIAAIAKRGQGGLVFRARHIWYGLTVLVPFILFVLAGVGYHYTVLQLAQKILATTWLIVAVLIVNALMLRWLFIANRRLVYAEARRRREAALKEKQEKGEETEVGEMDALALEEPELDRAAIGSQTRALLRTVMGLTTLVGVWAVWASVLPALQFFDDVVLWRYTGQIDGIDTHLPVSLTSLFSALITLMLTIAAARNLPGVLDLVVLGRIEMEPGTRYAVSTISRYVITAVGFGLILGFFGIGWSQVQWLVAALGVGLGFGLQEIFANFVSGLILLFEQPMRIGDIVTVGGTSGAVSRIRIRATTITDWDRRELVIPNKEFITGHFINWSLSDSVTRVVIPVGVAYGSDTALAEELLRKVARENPLVMEDPRPQIYLLEFAENSLNFELRVFTRRIDSRMPLLHQLHMAIDKEFRNAGINIAFPQRDIHLDADRPLEILLRREREGPKKEPGR